MSDLLRPRPYQGGAAVHLLGQMARPALRRPAETLSER